MAEALGVDPAEVKPGAKVTKIIAIKYTEDEAPTAKTLWAMDAFAHALGKFGRKDHANDAGKKIDPSQRVQRRAHRVAIDRMLQCFDGGFHAEEFSAATAAVRRYRVLLAAASPAVVTPA